MITFQNVCKITPNGAEITNTVGRLYLSVDNVINISLMQKCQVSLGVKKTSIPIRLYDFETCKSKQITYLNLEFENVNQRNLNDCI